MWTAAASGPTLVVGSGSQARRSGPTLVVLGSQARSERVRARHEERFLQIGPAKSHAPLPGLVPLRFLYGINSFAQSYFPLPLPNPFPLPGWLLILPGRRGNPQRSCICS